MNTPACVLVVPSYNEAQRFNAAEFRAFLTQRADTSLLFVNDGSTDDTPALLKGFQAEMRARIHVLDLPRNSGKAEAVRCGLLRALEFPGLSYAGFWDADLATPLSSVGDLLGILIDNPKLKWCLEPESS